jgi:IrrE N-terminal-like domain
MSAEDDAQQILTTVWAPASNGPEIPVPVDPFVIAKKLGIKAYTAGLDAGVSGMLIKRPGEDPEIYVHASDSPNRQRFTCAHELGHYVKRSAAGDAEWEYVERRDLLTAQGTDREEIYANQFAASLLMPRNAVERLHKTLGAVTLASSSESPPTPCITGSSTSHSSDARRGRPAESGDSSSRNARGPTERGG